MDIDAAPIFVKLQGQVPAAIQPTFAKISELYDRKLWFEFTNIVDQLFKEPSCIPVMLPLYRELILPLNKKISPDAFVRFSVLAAGLLGNAQEAVSLLFDISEQFKNTPHLFVFSRMSAAFYQLQLGQVSEAKAAIDECLPLFEAFTGVDPLIKASFFKVRSEYDKLKALFAAFYRDTFLYLACVKTEELPSSEQIILACDLSVSALLGDSVYNFGELLMHPVLDSIRGHPQFGFLVLTLEAFNNGDHGKFEALLPHISQNPILNPRIGYLREKLCLMSLVECVFTSLKTSRRISFSVISGATHVPIDQMEFLLMKALSLGTVKGKIDGVKEELIVEWVQPRVLNTAQLIELRASLQAWRFRIEDTSKSLDLVNSLPDVMAE